MDKDLEPQKATKFVEIKFFSGEWKRSVISESAYAIQYEPTPGPHEYWNGVEVITYSEKGSLKTHRYQFKNGASVIVIGDIVHLPPHIEAT